MILGYQRSEITDTHKKYSYFFQVFCLHILLLLQIYAIIIFKLYLQLLFKADFNHTVIVVVIYPCYGG